MKILVSRLSLALCIASCSAPAGKDADLIASSGETASSDSDTPYQVMPRADFIALTGCNITDDYDQSLKAALDYLVFDEGEKNPEYALQHSVNLFDALSQDGVIDAHCLTSSLKRIGLELGFLATESDAKNEGPYPLLYTSGSTSIPADNAAAFGVLSRRSYIDITGCKVSMSSYKKYHDSLYAFIFNKGAKARAQEFMKEFLSDVNDSQPLPDGSLDPNCLTPGIFKLGITLAILDANGTLLSDQELPQISRGAE